MEFRGKEAIQKPFLGVYFNEISIKFMGDML
jgi:hypothetical protein